MQSVINLERFKVISVPNRLFILIFFLILCFSANIFSQAERSVVRIRINNVDEGTGFIFNAPNQVVTALHVVAGHKNITVYSEATKNESPAKIDKVHKESDLALLIMDNDLGITRVEPNLNPNLAVEHTIWGYPRNVATMQGDPVRFSRSMNKTPTLSNILKVGDKIRTGLKNQGYPSPNVRILRLSSTIQPGHSGAPIFDNSGNIVGIADGGLYGGTARINWAISADYLSKLISEGIGESHPEFPNAPSIQAALFSSGNSEETTEVSFGEDKSLAKMRSVPLSEVYDLLAPEDKLDFDYLVNYTRQVTGKDLLSSRIDIYEDLVTGATISVPADISIIYDDEDGMLEAWSESENVELFIQIMNNEEWANGVEAKDFFAEYSEEWEDEYGDPISWEPDPENPDEPAYQDLEEAFFYQDRSRISRDTEGLVESVYFASLIIDEADFLGTAVRARGLSNLSEKDLLTYFVMSACVQLADFSID